MSYMGDWDDVQHGGVTGSIFEQAYYDEDGNGLFQTRDDIVILLGGPATWHLRLPDWVKKASQKQ
jgi:hypothetical protein